MTVETVADIEEILRMLDEAMLVSVKACTAYANLQNHPAFKNEGLPELLRAQEQNATSLIVQSKRIWEFVLNENSGSRPQRQS